MHNVLFLLTAYYLNLDIQYFISEMHILLAHQYNNSWHNTKPTTNEKTLL